jgi:ABC-type multidrug transport system fused ATPase/permease subunit
MRFWDVGTGRITLDGVDIRSLPIQTLRKHVTSMSQDTYLFDISVRDNIRFGAPGASDAAVFEAASAAGADGFIRELPQGYDTSCGERGARLSGGQRQRVAIARAFLHNPDVLVMDESVSSLDAENERILQDSLRSIRRGRTTLIIAHRLSTIRTADRIIVLDDGMVAESGTHEELLRRGGIYCTLVNDAAHGVVG